MLHLVADDVRIDATAVVWQFASVVRGAQIGAGCVIGPCALVDGSVMGSGCRVGHAASINPGCMIGDNVFIGPCAVLCNDMWPEVHKKGFDADLLSDPRHWAIVIAAGASIGANAVVLPGVSIGAQAIVAAGAVVCGNVPAGHLWRRDGTTSIVPPDRRQRRMRWAC